MDPLTILAGCTAAYNAIKSGIAAGKEIQGMIADVSSMMDSVGHLTQIAARPPAPSVFSDKSAEAIAMEAYTAKAKADELMNEVRNAFVSEYGLGAWDTVQAEATRIKKEAKLAAIRAADEAVKSRQEMLDALLVIFWAFGAVVLIGLGTISLLSFGHR